MGVIKLCFLLFCLFLVSVSSVKKIDNIDELRKTGYARSKPRHGRQLLFWFALQANFDQNNNIHLNFDLHEGHYGFHRFGNREHILPSLISGHRYYEVGNLNPGRYPNARQLPLYVRQFYENSNEPERNMDRLIVSVDQNRRNRIPSLFVTAHNLNRNDFNPSDTYEIDSSVIREIRQIFCHDNSEDESCSQFLEQIGYNNNYCRRKDRQKRSLDSQCNAFEEIKLQIKTTDTGYAKLLWKNIPAHILTTYQYVYIDICQNTYSKDTNKEPKVDRKTYLQIKESNGALKTSVYLNAGLQPRLRLYNRLISWTPVMWYGPEFDGANRELPIRIKGCDASLQLYAKDGKACARLYIKKTYSDWKNVLDYSWVGFYKSSRMKNDAYYTYEYVVNFKMIDNTTIEDYDIYQYDSSLTIAPGVQIRFLLDKKYDKVLAKTTPWEDVETPESKCNEGNLRPHPSLPWSFPEFFNEPDFYDANNVAPVKIPGYDAFLQLLTKDGKACSRLYIKKTFTDWHNKFYYSWVGFYSCLSNANKCYDTFQYAVNFEKMEDCNENFYIYQYKSDLTIAPGLQIRFLMDKGYDNKLAQTEPWKSG